MAFVKSAQTVRNDLVVVRPMISKNYNDERKNGGRYCQSIAAINNCITMTFLFRI